MYHNDEIRQGYYCDYCDEGCCSSHWIICSDCIQKLQMELTSAALRVKELEKELAELKKKEYIEIKN